MIEGYLTATIVAIAVFVYIVAEVIKKFWKETERRQLILPFVLIAIGVALGLLIEWIGGKAYGQGIVNGILASTFSQFVYFKLLGKKSE